MKIYGLIGYPLKKSFSPAYFNEKFKHENYPAEYKLFPLKSIQEFPTLLDHQNNICGLNVTIPYKEQIIPLLDSISPEAAEIGAVNTIVFNHGNTTGHNTDVVGFEALLNHFEIGQEKALIFGTGGASKAVQFVLKKRNIPFCLVSRNASDTTVAYQALTKALGNEHTIWINCTPVGMENYEEKVLPLPFEALTAKHKVIDLIYNPAETPLLGKAKKHTTLTINGLEMLYKQAEKAWELWRA